MTVEAEHHMPADELPVEKPAVERPVRLRWITTPVRKIVRFFRLHIYSSITRRIIFLNLAALVILLSGILYLNQFRAGLTDARVESLLIQGQIIAGAIAASATIETDAIAIDPDKLLELQAGDSLLPGNDNLDNLDFPIDPEQVAPVLRQLISPTRTRARIYDRDGLIILDSRHLYSRGQILRYDLPPMASSEKGFIDRIDDFVNGWLLRSDLPQYREIPGANGTEYPEVVQALTGVPASTVQVEDTGRLVVSVAVPVQRFRAVLGVLLLSTKGGEIDKIVRAERQAIVRVGMVAALVTVFLSIMLASTIAQPLRRLSAAAKRVRVKGKTRQEIPDFSDRHDEIGNLSVALRDMTSSLYLRIEAIESFAADVSHELKNPLTSLRSAVETLPRINSESQRLRLLDVIQHDVLRLDRLITDISNASRLDAELAREYGEEVDLAALLENIRQIHQSVKQGSDKNEPELEFHIPANSIFDPSADNRFLVSGMESRLVQVINNLIDNARSFVPAVGGRIVVLLHRDERWIYLVVEDNGPGIRAGQVEHIFDRFYTDRPEMESFGQHSGLGLSISRQIVEAHGGTISAENLMRPDGSNGARFIIRLPDLER